MIKFEFDADADYKSSWVAVPEDGMFSAEFALDELSAAPDAEVYFEITNANPPKSTSGVEYADSRTAVTATKQNIMLRSTEPVRAEFFRVCYDANTVSAGTVDVYVVAWGEA